MTFGMADGQQHGSQAAQERSGLNSHSAGVHQDSNRGTHTGASRNAQHVGRHQGVFKDPLVGRSREGEGAPHQQGSQYAGQTQGKNDALRLSLPGGRDGQESGEEHPHHGRRGDGHSALLRWPGWSG